MESAVSDIAERDLLLLQKSFFTEKGLVRQHLDSYNEFIDHGLQQIVDETEEINIELPENPYKIKVRYSFAVKSMYLVV